MVDPAYSKTSSGDGLSSGSPVHFILQNRWEVVDQLGQGGMGTVYMAKDLRLANRHCVVKKLRDDFFREEDKEKALAFFQREAVVLSRLQHPNIVHILDYFEENGSYYLVMEYVEGENLHQMLYKRGEPFPEEQVTLWAAQICDVLHYLHSHDPPVIYRDLKPSNVMIDTKDRVKLVDFGIARPYAEDADSTHVVSTGYSPPEQYWGAADPRSDMYALGATMFFLLTGREPHALQTSSPIKVNPSISQQTSFIVERATAQDPWLRFQTAPEMKEEIEARTDTEKKKIPVAWVVPTLATLAVLVACFGLFSFVMTVLIHANDQPSQVTLLQQTLEAKQQELENSKQELAKLLGYTGHQNLDSSGKKVSMGHDVVATPASSGHARLAFKEQNEAQSTDPEGLENLRPQDLSGQ